MVVEQRRAVDVDDAMSGGETNVASCDDGGRGEEVVVAVAAEVVATTVVADRTNDAVRDATAAVV